MEQSKNINWEKEFKQLETDLLNFIDNLDTRQMYEGAIQNAIDEEEYEKAELIKRNMIKECGEKPSDIIVG